MKFPPLNFDALTQANYLPSTCKSFDYTVTGYIVSPIFKHVVTYNLKEKNLHILIIDKKAHNSEYVR